MPALSYYTNVENTSLCIISEKGYQYWYDNTCGLYRAEKDGWDFAADNWTQLLGVIAIFEHHKPNKYSEYWWRIREPWLTHDVPDRPRDFEPVYGKS